MRIQPIESNLYLISLPQKLSGFDPFIGAWLYKGKQTTLLVDPGPTATVPELCEALGQLEVQRLDAVLLTHIHIDHAGGTGDFLARFPDTPVVCHAKGIGHLKDPARLWEGSVKTLGDTARAYGPIAPVPGELLIDAADFKDFGVQPVLTPGHAPHHVSYLKGDALFAGETGGVFQAVAEGYYLRPATPPRFFPETSTQSIDALAELPHRIYCFGHFGFTCQTPELLRRHKQQLQFWKETIQAQQAAVPADEQVDRCVKVLIETDPLMARWPELSPADQQREWGFLRNSVKGFLGYLKEKGAG